MEHDTNDLYGMLVIWQRRNWQEPESQPGKTPELIQMAQEHQIRSFGVYDCTWSTKWNRFCFLLAPAYPAAEKYLSHLEQAGVFQGLDVKFTLGISRTRDKEANQGHVLLPEAERSEGGNPENPLGFHALWSRTESFYKASPEDRAASSRKITRVFDQARELGVVTFGRYECRWSSRWKFFTFWTAPSLEVLNTVFNELEEAGDFYFANPLHRMGYLRS
jgi:hypothetical protein